MYYPIHQLYHLINQYTSVSLGFLNKLLFLKPFYNRSSVLCGVYFAERLCGVYFAERHFRADYSGLTICFLLEFTVVFILIYLHALD